jgi:hypothetical protein
VLFLSANDCKSMIVLTSRGFVCVCEAAAPLMAAVEPSPSTNDVNSSEGSKLVGAMRGDVGVVFVCWRWLWGELWPRNWADSTAHHGFDVFARTGLSYRTDLAMQGVSYVIPLTPCIARIGKQLILRAG